MTSLSSWAALGGRPVAATQPAAHDGPERGMGALDCGMAGDQLPGAVPVADTTPAADDMNATPEQSVLEV
jgi:hypothetical protein